MNFKISCLVICASLASSLNSCKRRGEETRAPGQAVAPATSTATPDSNRASAVAATRLTRSVCRS